MATPDPRSLKVQLLEADIKFKTLWEKNGRPSEWLKEMTDREVAGSFIRRLGDAALDEWRKAPSDYTAQYPAVEQLLIDALGES